MPDPSTLVGSGITLVTPLAFVAPCPLAWCLPLIHVCEVLAACLALALANSLSFSAFFSLSFSKHLSFLIVALSRSAFALNLAWVCSASLSLTSSCTALIPLFLPEAGTGAAEVAVVGAACSVSGTGVGGAAARTLPAWAEALARSSATM